MKRGTEAQFATTTLGAEEVDPYCDEDADVKGDPKPDARRHRGEVFMLRGARQSQIARRASTAYTSQWTDKSHQWTRNYRN